MYIVNFYSEQKRLSHEEVSILDFVKGKSRSILL